MCSRKLFRSLILSLIVLSIPAPAAWSQSNSGAVSLFLDPSVRAAGMGRVSAAVFWGDDPNYWANPALLGYHHGIRYEKGRTQLVPDLADDVYFRTKRVTLGAWGLGISMAGKPWDTGELRLDYGESIITDPGSPDPIGTFFAFEEIESFGVGGNLFELYDNLRGAFGKTSRLHRFGDVSVGWSVKTDSVDLAPETVDMAAAAAKVTTHDLGFALRATPYNSIDDSGYLPALDRALKPIVGGIRVDLGYGRGKQNVDDATISLSPGRPGDPIVEADRRGWSARLAVGFPEAIGEPLRESGAGWLVSALTPLVSIGKGWDRTGYKPDYVPVDSLQEQQQGDIEESGWEVTIANIYTIRRGRIDDPEGQIHGDTDGWSVGFRLGDIAGFRYDEATIPQYVELDRVSRVSRTFFVDALALWRTVHGKQSTLESTHY